MIGIGYNSSEMDRDRYSGNCLFKVEADNGKEGSRKRNRKRFCVCVCVCVCVWGGGGPHTTPSIRYPERRRTSRYSEVSEFLIPRPPPPPLPRLFQIAYSAIKRFFIFVRRSGTSLASKCKHGSSLDISFLCHSYTVNKCYSVTVFAPNDVGKGVSFIRKNSLRKNNVLSG